MSPVSARIAFGSPASSSTVLAPGDPPLTQKMVDERLAVWEEFLELKFTPAERKTLRDDLVAAWKAGDKDVVKNTLSDDNLYGQHDKIADIRRVGQSTYVDKLDKPPILAGALDLKKFYYRAHPDRKNVLESRGLGDLVGTWKRGDALTPDRNPVTNGLSGVSMTDSLTLNIYPDGHFRHQWSHTHCDNGNLCCDTFATDVSGSIAGDKKKLVLNGTAGNELVREPCMPKMNHFGPIKPHEETFQWSISRNSDNQTVLCLSSPPFHPWDKKPEAGVCYVKQ
jgi:hypothetical protein